MGEAVERAMEIPYRVKLDVFEGPLDLLLHLIRENEVDIYDIPIALIAEQYMATLDLMKTLNLDMAGEFLYMAATLAHIKSKMLLPPSEDEEPEEEDPRAELVAQLLEYQRYKEAAAQLDARPQLYRDLFPRAVDASWSEGEAEGGALVEVSVFELMQAFRRLLDKLPVETVHEITVEKITLQDKVHELLERLAGVDSLSFEDLLSPETTRRGLVLSFLALLELARLRIVRVLQATAFGSIWIEKAVSELPDEREFIGRVSDGGAGPGGAPAGSGKLREGEA
jgi:segregation and condensation protein A